MKPTENKQKMKPDVIVKGAKVLRADDSKLLATVQDDGTVKFANPAYASGEYREAIESAVLSANKGPAPVETDDDESDEPEGLMDRAVDVVDARVPSSPPPRHPELGSFSAAHVNFDHANASDEDFAAKYKPCAGSILEFIARSPDLFADREALEVRLHAL